LFISWSSVIFSSEFTLSLSVALWEEDSTSISPFSTILVIYSIMSSLSCEVTDLSIATYNLCKKRKNKKLHIPKCRNPFPFFSHPTITNQ
jgi:hypothetical protein